jgi:Zn-dependent metalloprotease
MKKIISLLLIIFCVFSLYSQELLYSEAEKVIPGASHILLDENSGSILFIRLNNDIYISEHEHRQWLTDILIKPGSEIILEFEKEEKDNFGFTHYYYKQFYKSYPVEYSVYKVHIKNGRVISANGEFYDGITIDTGNHISGQAALESAIKFFDSRNLINDESIIEKPVLRIFPFNKKYFLAWKFDLYSSEPLKREYVYVDAHTGDIITTADRIHYTDVPATGVTMYSGIRPMITDSLGPGNYRLREYGRGNGIETFNMQNTTNHSSAIDFTNTVNYWNSTTNLNNAANDVHFGTEMTYDYFLLTHGRNSYDNAGAVLKSYVHYGNNYVNAFWNGSGMTYGDGNGISTTPLTSIEVVGHEIMHAFTEYTAGLIYSNESGALNESFSDIFGTVVDYYANPLTANYLIGDQFSVTGTPFRNMQNPNAHQHPDTYLGTYWSSSNAVHTNSGVQNFWFYLLAEGGSGVNDNGNTFTVNGIGRTKAAAIAFRNLSVYLTPNSNYSNSRFYAIQSANDLYGTCSNEVIQTTNAWYAVGVGGLFTNAVTAGFTSSQTQFCALPAVANFQNTSINASGYHWNFGDGNTSVLPNPVHTYTSGGSYTVTLIASGGGSCTTADTIIITNYIVVTPGMAPGSPSCAPATQNSCCGVGILNVNFNSINNTSGNAIEGYKDFTCQYSTTLIAGSVYPLSVTTGSTYFENVKAWIDFDNDGQFNNTNELIFVSDNKLINHTGYIYTPHTAPINVPIRMRVIDERNINAITSSCYSPVYGQAEDYTIIFSTNTLPPVADFTSDAVIISTGDTVFFYNLTQNAPDSVKWFFPGGNPSSFNSNTPFVIYNSPGSYSVSLTAYNAFGTDSITKTQYITAVNTFYMCSGNATNVESGLFYDSGGPTGNYQNNENCSFLIEIPCASNITLTFTEFNLQSSVDILSIYDGSNETSPLLFSGSGTILPPPVEALSGRMYIKFVSSPSTTRPGWQASWTSTLITTPAPIADFVSSNTNPPLNYPVTFSDISSNNPVIWDWNFGDGNFSTQKNPVHSYTSSGNKTITLIVTGCFDSDTISKNITVQQSPIYSVSPGMLDTILTCGDSITIPVMIYNHGTGDLFLTSNSHSPGNSEINVLALTYGTDMSTEYPNTIAAINAHFTDYNLTPIYTTSGAQLDSALAGKNVFLMTEPENGNPAVYTAFATPLLNFVNNGGTVIFCGAASSQLACITNTGLINATYGGYTTSGSLTVTDPTNYLLDSLSLPIAAANATFGINILNVNNNSVVKYLTYDVVAERAEGNGKIVYIGYDYFAYNNSASRIISNALRNVSGNFGWLSTNLDTLIVSPGDSVELYVNINSAGMLAGNYNGYILINTNDPVLPLDTFIVTIQVTGTPQISLSDTCINFPSIMELTSVTDSIKIINSGCDTLQIANIISSNADFVPAQTILQIPPYDSVYLSINFNPSADGIFSALLSILNNDNDTVICLTGTAFPAPVISISPDTLNITLSCNDSASTGFYIINTGMSNLDYNIYMEGSAGEDVLASTYGCDLFDEYPNTILSINQFFTSYNFSDVNTTLAAVLDSALQNNNVLLIPEIESGLASIFTSFAPVVNNFVNNGGTAIICGSNNTNLFALGLISGSYKTYTSSATLTVLNATHPLMDSVPASFMAPNATFALEITNPGKISLVRFNGWEVVTEIPYGDGKILYVGFDYWAYNSATQRIIANAMKYALESSNTLSGNITPSSGSTASNDSTLITLQVSTFGLTAGLYTHLLYINSNDPLIPVVTLPVNITVTGDPLISLSDTCINYGTVINNFSFTDTIEVHNSGCDTLHISSVIPSSSFVNVALSSSSVPPAGSVPLSVTFAPQTIGTHQSLITISGNSVTKVICIEANVLPAPVAIVIPDTLVINLQACNDSVSADIMISNTGGSDLIYSISPYDSSVQLLVLTYGVDMINEYPNTINAISSQFNDYELSTINTTNSATLQTALTGKNVLLIPKRETASTSVFTGFSTVLQNFVNDGGVIIFCGSTSSQSQTVFNSGLFTGSYASSIGSLNVTNVLPTHAVMQNMPLTFTAPINTYTLNITNSDKISLASYNNTDAVAYRKIGNGYVFYLGFDYSQVNSVNSSLIGNIFKWIVSYPEWIKVTLSDTIVIPGDSTLLTLSFNSSGLSGGNYLQNLYFNSNDPFNTNLTIPVQLNVNYNPCAVFTMTEVSCNGEVCFTSDVINIPTSYHWNFGDGNTNTTINPCHTYSSPGIYTVKFSVCNSYGCDTIIKIVNVITVSAPVSACVPSTSSYCCSAGIYNVQFGSINNSSLSAIEGYKDFSCSTSTNLFSGFNYNLQVTTGPTSTENVRAWIDYNNNGQFEASELIFSSNNILQYHTGIISVPGNAVMNQPLRMRIGSDSSIQPAPEPCVNAVNGQFEDYTVVIVNSNIPSAAFSYMLNNCSPVVQFMDQSNNSPNNWYWNFGDGNYSTLQNPVHTYSSAGNFIVTLIVNNVSGSDTAINNITVNFVEVEISVSGSFVTGDSLNFSAVSAGAVLWFWDFGDGNLSAQQNPVHVYSQPGTYIVSLVTQHNNGCITIVSDTIQILPVGIDIIYLNENIKIYPNPAIGEFNIDIQFDVPQSVSIQLIDATGRLVRLFETEFVEQKRYSVTDLEQGIYFIKIHLGDKEHIYKLVNL